MSQLSPICSADIVTQPYGCTDYAGEWVRPECVGGHFHAGIDLGWSDGGNNHLGEPVYARAAGQVVAIGPVCPSNGALYLGPYAPCIQDAQGVIWLYGHVQAVYVQVGSQVAAGTRIAAVGSLGASSGGHVHVELRTDAAIQGPPWAYIVNPTEEVLMDPRLDAFLNEWPNVRNVIGRLYYALQITHPDDPAQSQSNVLAQLVTQVDALKNLITAQSPAGTSLTAAQAQQLAVIAATLAKLEAGFKGAGTQLAGV